MNLTLARAIATALSVVVLTPWVTILAAGIHDMIYPAEDSQIIWVCAWDGDRQCGNGPDISIRLPWKDR